MVKTTTKRICDCCGREAMHQFYQFKVKRFSRAIMFEQWIPKDYLETWDMCGECLEKIKKMVKESEEE